MKQKTDGFIQFIAVAIIATLVTLGGVAFYASNYFTLDDLDKLKILKIDQKFSSTLTTITSATKISDLATILPNNFNALNTDKLEIATFGATTTHSKLSSLLALDSVGTITTGTWNATAISVSKGGTGTTSPTRYMTILGDGANGLTHASSTGTSGQFLTSNGATAYPSWTTGSIDTSLLWNWTGTNLFKNFNASSTATNPAYFNGVSYVFPSAQGTSTSVLMNDGNGTLYWNGATSRVYTNTTAVTVASSVSTTTLTTFTLPANFMGTQNILRLVMNVSAFRVTANKGVLFTYAYGAYSATSTIYSVDGDTTSQSGTITFDLMGRGTTNDHEGQFHLSTQRQGSTIDLDPPSTSGIQVEAMGQGSYPTDSTVNQTITIAVQFTNNGANDNITVDNAYAYIIR